MSFFDRRRWLVALLFGAGTPTPPIVFPPRYVDFTGTPPAVTAFSGSLLATDFTGAINSTDLIGE